MNLPVISVVNVTKRFDGHIALNGVSLDVTQGATAVVLGPSGCGKTTLLRVIAGLETPDEGEVVLEGGTVAASGRAIVPPHKRGLGFVFQDLALWPHLTVRENLNFVLGATGLSSADRQRRIEEALALVRVEKLATRYPSQLSGGEQQRVALARAIVGQPRVLLMDEPLSSLDAELRSGLRSELANLQRALTVTMVYVTHDREDAAALADYVIEMRQGRVVTRREISRRQERA